MLTTLPDEIGELKELKVLLVAGNPVTLKEMRKTVKIQKISSQNYETGAVYSQGFFKKIETSTPVFFIWESPSFPGLT